jgi:hypothetical protein
MQLFARPDVAAHKEGCKSSHPPLQQVLQPDPKVFLPGKNTFAY